MNALAAGTELAAAVLVGLGGGYWLDSVCGTGPWLSVLGAMAGMALALYRLIKLSRIGRKDD
ncbi:MAG: AtpZ/AtpI family protein [Elusimicrobia bacterium]|nr:AtpZ/AtpI family protein [Elusimicrobiota bacterium]